MKFKVLLLIIFIASSSSSFARTNDQFEWNFPKDEQSKWTLVSQRVEKSLCIEDYVPAGESLENCSEMVSVFGNPQEIYGEMYDQISAFSIMDMMFKEASQDSEGKFKYNVIFESKNDCLFEFYTPKTQYKNSIHGIFRIIKSPYALYTLSYIKNGSTMSDKTKDKWLRSMKEARIISDDNIRQHNVDANGKQNCGIEI